MSETTPMTDPTLEVEKKDAASEQSEQAKKNLLFGSIGYTDDSAYENFLQNMNLNQAVFVLIASANFAQAKGAFNMLEAEVLSNAIRRIRKTSESAQAEAKTEQAQ